MKVWLRLFVFLMLALFFKWASVSADGPVAGCLGQKRDLVKFINDLSAEKLQFGTAFTLSASVRLSGAQRVASKQYFVEGYITESEKISWWKSADVLKIGLIDESGARSIIRVNDLQERLLFYGPSIEVHAPYSLASVRIKSMPKGETSVIVSGKNETIEGRTIYFPEIEYRPPIFIADKPDRHTPDTLSAILKQHAEAMTGKKLGKVIGSGGMQVVFEIPSEPGKLLKIFNPYSRIFGELPPRQRAAEIAFMMQRKWALYRFLNESGIRTSRILSADFVKYGITIEEKLNGLETDIYIHHMKSKFDFNQYVKLADIVQKIKPFEFRLKQILLSRYDLMISNYVEFSAAKDAVPRDRLVGVDVGARFGNFMVPYLPDGSLPSPQNADFILFDW